MIKDKYGVGSDQLRAYIHYHPSYYHLHVHFMHLNVDAGAGMAAGKAHLLDEVIGKRPYYGICCAFWDAKGRLAAGSVLPASVELVN